MGKKDLPVAQAVSVPATNPAYNPTHIASAPHDVGPPPGGFGRVPVMTVCPNCQAKAQTRIEQHVTVFTLVVIVILYMVAWPLCWLPLFLPDLKSNEHYCRRCNYRVANKKYPWSKKHGPTAS